MKAIISFRALAITLFIAFGVTYILCIVGDLLFGWVMFKAWAPFLPGFTWPLTISGFLIGLVWIVACSVYSAALIAWPYNYFVKRQRSP